MVVCGFEIESVSTSIHELSRSSGVEKVAFWPCLQQAKQMAGDGLLWNMLWRLILYLSVLTCLYILPLLARLTCDTFTMAYNGNAGEQEVLHHACLSQRRDGEIRPDHSIFCKTTPAETLSETWAWKDRKTLYVQRTEQIEKGSYELWVVLKTQLLEHVEICTILCTSSVGFADFLHSVLVGYSCSMHWLQ